MRARCRAMIRSSQARPLACRRRHGRRTAVAAAAPGRRSCRRCLAGLGVDALGVPARRRAAGLAASNRGIDSQAQTGLALGLPRRLVDVSSLARNDATAFEAPEPRTGADRPGPTAG